MDTMTSLDQLGIQLFRTFARTEYPLKASGYSKIGRRNEASADWDRFAKEVEQLISNPMSPALKEAIEFIFNAPPKKQVIVDGVLTWQVGGPPSSSRADELLVYVRRVRNNLFHGGKFNGNWFAPQRSEDLLRHSLVILECCIQHVPSVKEAYES
ncbi:MAG: hypothetical protein JWP89_5650 [Schlesneria sp.]|nr:hypothetical protein [Schlesneria sp.]